MAKPPARNGSDTRQHLLEAALKRFADSGYAATSIQQIVDDARVSKPALYYHFPDKAGLFQALVDRAHDERYQLMQAAAARGQTVAEKMVEVVAGLFDFSLRNRELMRLAFATAFAAPGEMPQLGQCREKGRRNFEFLRSLLEEGQNRGELDQGFASEELAMGLYGPVTTYVMVGVILAGGELNRHTAQRLVALFLRGATARPGRAATPGRAPRRRVAKP
jgi:AcrR family transcriptional regulator